MWCNLFYDKYIGDINGNGDHHYNNQITSKISINDLEDGSYKYYVEKEAREIYNNIFKGYFALPECVHTSPLYKLKIYMKNEDSLETIYVIVSVNTTMLEELIENKTEISHIDFLKKLCQYHIMYTETIKFINNNTIYGTSSTDIKIEHNVDYIIANANKAVDYTFDNKVNAIKEITVDLFEYQKCSIYWMTQKETNKHLIRYNLNDEVLLGNAYYDTITHTFNLTKNKKSLQFDGGAIIDEVGLGKTLQVIGLSISNPPNSIEYIRKDIANKFCSKATLIFCPNQLCGQWVRELIGDAKGRGAKINKDYNVKVVKLLTKVDYDKITYNDLLDADFVVVSYTFLGNKIFTVPWTSKVSTLQNFANKTWKGSDIDTFRTLFTTMGKELLEDPINTMYKTNPLIQLIHWHRFVIDEFHEIYKDSYTYNYISNLLPFITTDNKWCVTATPFNQKKCLFKIIDFVTNYKNMDGDKIYTLDSFVDYMSTNVFRRNTKDSVKEEHTLPPIKEEIRFLKFSQTERMMYNAHLANPNNSKFSVYLRQLCCHPLLAEETKEALSNCKTLEDIEKMMVTHYKIQMDEAQEKVDKIVERINKINKKIKKLEKKQKKRQMKKMGLKVEDSDKDSDDTDDDDDDNDEDDDADIEAELMMAMIKKGNNNIGMNIKPSITIENLKQTVKEVEVKLKEATVILEGKKSTYNFFNNVVERLRKTSAKETIDKTNKFDPSLEGDTNIMDLLSKQQDNTNEDEDICGICMDDISENNVGVTKCGHVFCFDCLNMAVSKSHKCPYCNNKLTDKELYVLSYEKKKKKEEEIVDPKNKTKQDLINELGTKLANIITYLRETKEHTIIFSQWDDLLRRIGRILMDNNIPNVFCRGNCYQRDKAIREFNGDDKIKVIMLSSDSTAAGTNLTKASQVIFIDPIYGDYKFRKDQEKQAIGRAHRLGQKSNIKVIRFIIKDSIEEDIYNMNVEEDKNHKSEFESTTEVVIN
jgi:SNF2 family DNA or RNA helicase